MEDPAPRRTATRSKTGACATPSWWRRRRSRVPGRSRRRGGILSRLKVGAFDVAVFDGYTSLGDSGLDIVAVYTNSGATCDALDAHVIFRVFDDNGRERYLKKVLSVVNVLGVDLSFRKIERE